MILRWDIIISAILLIILIFLYRRLRIKLLKEYPSKVQGTVRVYEKYNKEKVLNIGYNPQGVSLEDKSISESYWFRVSEIVLDFLDKKPADILFFGLGTSTMNHLIYKQNKKVRQTVVEYDQAIIDANFDYFELDKIKNISIINDNAYTWINKKNSHKFDVAIVDMFTDQDPFAPSESNKLPFLEKLINKLKKHSLLVFNRPIKKKYISSLEPSIKRQRDYLSKYFKEIKLFLVKDPRGYLNMVIVAKDLR